MSHAMEDLLRLLSQAFENGGFIPSRYTDDGQNWSPPLSWSDAPDSAESFVIFCEDPDAPNGLWHHWAIFDIPKKQHSLAAHFRRTDTAGGPRQAKNDFDKLGYDGPAPPRGDGPHRYRFRLLALSRGHLGAGSEPPCTKVAELAGPFVLAQAELTGLYQR